MNANANNASTASGANGSDSTAMSASEMWRVQLATGEVRMMTIDGIDRAFDEGMINARTHVLAPNETTWSTLGEAAGLEDPALADTVVANGLANEPNPDPTPSLSPVALSMTPSIAPPAPLSLSFDPSSLDDLDMMPKPRSRAPFILGIVGAVAVAATIAGVAGKASSSVVGDTKAANAMQAAPQAAAPLPEPAKKAELTDEQKKKLLDADKARDEKARAKNQERAEKAERTQKRKSVKSGPVFVNGGDKFDPLNGKL